MFPNQLNPKVYDKGTRNLESKRGGDMHTLARGHSLLNMNKASYNSLLVASIASTRGHQLFKIATGNFGTSHQA